MFFLRILQKNIIYLTILFLPISAFAVNVDFKKYSHNRLEQIYANGKPLLAPGCGFYIIGGFNNLDSADDNVSSCGSDGRNLKNSKNATIPFELHFNASGSNYIDFGATIDTRQVTLTSLSLPLDARQDSFTHFRFSNGDIVTQGHRLNGSTHSYDQLRHTYWNEGSSVQIGFATSHSNWVELISPQYTIKYEIFGNNNPIRLAFVDHDGIDVRNGEFGFISPSGHVHYIHGRITVLETNPSFYSNSVTHVFEAENLYHEIGRRDGAGWSANVNDPKRRYLSYGPYTQAIEAGNHIATFRLMLDNVRADNNRIVRIDVWDAARGIFLARKILRRRDFNRRFRYQDFALPFQSQAGANLELRVFYIGSSYVNFDKVTVQ